jgi:peptide/nickel transport system substrate-binding protein
MAGVAASNPRPALSVRAERPRLPRRARPATTFAFLVLALGGVAACGGGSRTRRSESASAVTVLMGRAPDSLDPGAGSSPEALEADWLVYTPLLTFAHAHGVTGTRLIPGLATDLPTITNGGTRYSFTLRPGLVYSNGQTVRASDFEWAVERAIRLRWGGARNFIVDRIKGAAAFAGNRTDRISGIHADDPSGRITIELTAAYGPFDDVLALPALAPVPTGTPLRDEQRSPPPGVGPYRIEQVVPGRSFKLVRNTRREALDIPGVQSGHVDVEVRISPDLAANARAVLRNAADVFDSADQIPADVLGRASTAGPPRYSRSAQNETYSLFLDPSERPFSSQLARRAVLAGLDRGAVARVAAGTLLPGCYLLPPAMSGHPSAPCPYGGLRGGADLSRARSLVDRAGMRGVRVVVQGEPGWPLAGLTAYYTSLLNRMGFRASQRLGPRPDAGGPRTGAVSPVAQTGFASFAPSLPDPALFYVELIARGVADPNIVSQARVLAAVPAGQLDAVASSWRALDEYTTSKGYVAVLGYPTAPVLLSSRIDGNALVFQPVVGIDWSSLELK